MQKEPIFSVALMHLDLLDVRSQLNVLNGRASAYHVDIMDGHFAPGIALSPDFLRRLGHAVALTAEAHLMTTDPNRWIDAVAEAGAGVITVHAETINECAFSTLNRISALGCHEGVAVNPATSLAEVEYYLDRLDILTIMTVDPGAMNQPLIEAMLRKVEAAREWKERHGYHYTVQVEGACNEHTFGRLWQAGAESFVLGESGLFSLDKDISAAYGKMVAGFQRATQTVAVDPSTIEPPSWDDLPVTEAPPSDEPPEDYRERTGRRRSRRG